MTTPNEHALLSASASKRWLNCPPSVRLTEGIPERTSEYAEEGRLAHEIAQLHLTKRYIGMGPRKFADALAALKTNPLYTAEMEGYVQEYEDFIESIVLSYPKLPYVAVEQRVDYSSWAPNGFGTCDCLISYGDALHVVDLKYGQGVPVDAEENSQMMLYALGAIDRYRMFGPVNTVRMTIFQPRTDGTNTWETTADQLLGWGESIKPIAQLAFEGKGEYRQGEWCRFCKARATCRERAERNTALQDFGMKKPPQLSDAEVGQALTLGRSLADWLKDLEDYALAQCLAGNEIPGWKAVEGRSLRQFTDTDQALSVAKAAGIDEAMLYVKKPITLSELEKIMGKKPFSETLGAYVVKPAGKPALAQSSDKRKAITNKTNARSDFEEAIS